MLNHSDGDGSTRLPDISGIALVARDGIDSTTRTERTRMKGRSGFAKPGVLVHSLSSQVKVSPVGITVNSSDVQLKGEVPLLKKEKMQNFNLSPIEKLSDKNYLIWANRIESELRGLKLWRRIIEGEEVEKPIETDKKFDEKMKIWEDWDDDNAIARNLMNRTMNDTQVLKYSSEKSAKKLWNIIGEEMASKNEDLEMKNRIELSKLKMNEDETVDDYLNRAMIIKSKSIQAGDEIKDRELICFVLEGLRVEFDFDIKIIKSDRQNNMNTIRQILKETEEKLKLRKEEKRQTEIASKAREGRTGRRNFAIKCFNCGKMGHISRECRGKIKCFKCGGFGHKSEICRKNRGEENAEHNYNGPRRGVNRRNYRESTGHVMETSEVNYGEEDQGDEKIRWTMDSGASSHMVSKKELFIEYEKEERIIATAEKGAVMKSSGIGDIRMKSNVDEGFIKFENVLHVPDLREGLLSVAKIVDHDLSVLFSKYKAEVIGKDGEILYEARRNGDKFEVEGILNMEIARKAEVDDMLWHQRLAHVNFQKLKEINFTFVIPIANKSQTADSIINLIIQEERQTGRKVKIIRNDNGGEYISNYLRRWLSSKGIKQEFTTAYTPESNGKAERFNRTIVESARTMLIDSKLPLKFWSESVKVAVHINNRIKIKEMNTTPFEIYKGWKPNIVYLKRFGSEAYVHIRKEKRKKMEPKAHKRIMMGYSMIRKGYRIYLPEMNNIHEVSDVKFNEAKLGYYLMNNRDENDIDLSEIEEIPPDVIITTRRRGPEPGMTREKREERDLRLRETEEEELIKKGVRRSERLRLIKNKENVSDRTYEIKCPKDYQEALNSDDRKQWIKAMEDEMQRINKLKVWRLIDRPKDKKLIKSRWIFSIKKNSDGSIKNFKARLVATGYDQILGSDYHEIYSPTIRPETIRILIKIAAMKKLFLSKRTFKQLFYMKSFLYLGIHVDDILSVGSGDDFEENIWKKIKREIDITDLGAAKNFLGMEFEYRDNSIFINQKKYIEEILETYNLRDCNPSKTPLCISTNYDLFENSKSIDQNYYQEKLLEN
ncbi:hypothetical protein LAZ67_4001843 [Cordylochernes scorpioides]|uniref:Uncharacterized protein n=1 Tax=Cordylochernes scorpioides TaxID=51811 RepID=A0ABY6KCH3_9ARAC|nr:hypothetical protein LAZ67_4001843 [Cordylochernes scorpioides]